jgi:hypothetical protein
VKTVIEKRVMANPRTLVLNISEKTAATTAKGHAPNMPPQNLQSNMVCKSFAEATPTWKMENPNIEITSGSLLPSNSLRGAQNRGPKANPRT